MENKEIVVTGNTPVDMAKLAFEGKIDLDKLEKVLNLQERYEANEAKKAYHIAMIEFKKNPPEIKKDKKVSFGNTKYNHASLSNVTDKINEVLSMHGLSASWSMQQNGTIAVTCKITHIKGHSESTTLSAPSDTSGSKNAIQAIGSTISYLQRYTLLALAGLTTHEMDDDGKSSQDSELITLDEKNTILDLLILSKIDQVKFLNFMKLEKLEDMPKSEVKKAMVAIENAKNHKKVK